MCGGQANVFFCCLPLRRFDENQWKSTFFSFFLLITLTNITNITTNIITNIITNDAT
ncbi:hypothetical protein SODALDRAFT_362713 [Sodiomyces alkalinus F11]|uniref:Uncharacterized protein n=1 Tax=Sodiomyces alkalinus (strain CBS 110278 / VKM F-3762 / F11) TaxID=1314773 RepID=A0A3N2PMW9_SODAK|nr:hypothetical protein SODALDRAFT_362713 [Sodiomyces alkalinus F11]ROT35867.1 hypothetical protein SODALDRAFT_362713 [Sodiomyces alkalinus F11]